MPHRKLGTPAHWKLISFSSKYSQRMRRLSCKIFNDFYVPELNKNEFRYGIHHQPTQLWIKKWFNDLRVVERNMERPIDLDPRRNWNYYPAHPQLRALTHELREYGLFRDEHRDFTDEMKAIAISKGKSLYKGPKKAEQKK